MSYKGYGDIHIEWRHLPKASTNREKRYKIMNWGLSIYPGDGPGTDTYAIKEKKYISITPIKISLLHNKRGLKALRDFLIRSDE